MKIEIKSVDDWKILKPSFHQAPYAEAGCTPWAVIVFVKKGSAYVLAKIPHRGWTVPSGRIDPGETPVQTAIRETWEEIGAHVNPEKMEYLGYYLVRDQSGECVTVPTYFTRVSEYGDVPQGSESLGIIRCDYSTLKDIYWIWDDLLERVFGIAEECAKLDQKD